MSREHTRELARERDNWTCQICFKKWHVGQRSFDVHHLHGICGKKSRGYDSIKDVHLLITLCHKCHFSLDEVRSKVGGPKGPKEKTIKRVALIKQMIRTRMRRKDIAIALGVSRQTVSVLKKRYL